MVSSDAAGEGNGESSLSLTPPNTPPRHDLAALAAEKSGLRGLDHHPGHGAWTTRSCTHQTTQSITFAGTFTAIPPAGGTPFLDGRNTAQAEDQNLIVYGHNMMDGSMFKPLLSYLEPSFRETHQEIYLETIRKTVPL